MVPDLESFPCRGCRSPVRRPFVDLGEMPLANAYLDVDSRPEDEPRYPLRAFVCDECLLVQLDHHVAPTVLFDDYAYFSSYSDTWSAHAEAFAASAIEDWNIGSESLVVEIASNDGYLLRHFMNAGVPVLGIEPAQNVAEAAIAAGIPTEVCFFDSDVAAALVDRGVRADLVVANNVFAHVPDPYSFAKGLASIVKPDGVISLEFPHLVRLIQGVQFDTIYHEHFSYFSLFAVERLLGQVGLHIFDVIELSTHGGSLRVLAERSDRSEPRPERQGVFDVRRMEAGAQLNDMETYEGFAFVVEQARDSFLELLHHIRGCGRAVAGYGAAAKGNTLLNYSGVTVDDVPYVVDRNPHKQGRLLPGTRIPVRDPSHVDATRPEYLLVLPWNLTAEITEQMSRIRTWGGKFVVPLPTARVVP